MSTQQTIQLFVVSPSNETTPYLVIPSCTTVNDIRRIACPHSSNDAYDSIRLSVDGRPLYGEKETLKELGIGDGAVIRTLGRLKGGAMLNIIVKTKFGCLCCNNRCAYDCCRRGRNYKLSISTIAEVSSIFQLIGNKNPTWKAKNAQGTLITKKGIVLEPNRKIIFYDLVEGQELMLQMTPCHWFTGAFRTTAPEDEEDHDEFMKAVAMAKEAKKQKKEEEVAKVVTNAAPQASAASPVDEALQVDEALEVEPV